ncbi:hypothetical protein ABZ085_09285, partial [Streptomyces albidoflavus]|uniref:hypothetical protein n=1 Tax=Streptomyces albidoflavus TaxID=1886 RepID=UPI0033AEEC19
THQGVGDIAGSRIDVWFLPLMSVLASVAMTARRRGSSPGRTNGNGVRRLLAWGRDYDARGWMWGPGEDTAPGR